MNDKMKAEALDQAIRDSDTESDTGSLTNSATRNSTISIAATFTAEPLNDSLRYWIDKLGVEADIEFAPYNNVMQSLLDAEGLFAHNKGGLNIVLLRLEDWRRLSDGRENTDFFQQATSQLISALQTAASTTSSPMLVCLCPPSSDAASDLKEIARFRRVEEELRQGIAEFPSIRFISATELLILYPVADYYDATADKLGHIPFKPAMFTALGTVIMRTFHSLHHAPYKVIVLDCDETLWAGVCGERGPACVNLDFPSRALQNFMKKQKARGMLLCVCSKNNRDDVDAVFDAHSEMPLRREDIAAWRINWHAKSENIRSLAEELNLGLDSFIFVDDNPMETAEVRANCPGVLALTLPRTRDQIPEFLDHVWAFDRFTITVEDQNRTAMYQESRARNRFRESSLSFADFLTGLALEIQIRELGPSELARGAQLTQRTNQFNLCAQRYTEADIQRMILTGVDRILTVFVRDRFGDYGQVGLIFYEIKQERMEVRNLLLSCRVLGKGVEHAMLAHLGRIAQKESLSTVIVPCVHTAKNVPARRFLEGFPPSFREDLVNGFTYHFPADFAAGTRFSPNSREDPKNSDADLDAKATSHALDAFASDVNFAWIAENANDVSLILQAVNASKRRSRGGRTATDLPRNELERQITLIWEHALAISPIGTHDNYFDLGGDSLTAVRVFVDIHKLTGRDLPLVTLLEAPTIAQLADLLADSNWKPHWRSLVPIKSSGSRPPFYCVHGVGGNIVEFTDMTRYFHPDQPFYGIQAIGLDGKSCRQNLTVEQMATHYISEIREFQPEGPYYIGGSSFGGLVAYEMARQLKSQGLEVGMVALFDTHGPGYPTLLPTTTVFRRRLNSLRFRASLHWSNLVATEPKRRPGYVWIKTKRCKRAIVFKVRSWIDSARRSATNLLSTFLLPGAIRRVNQAGHWAAGDYVPGEYEGAITLFRATDQPLGIYPDPTLGWSSVVRGRIDIYDTPGHHGTLVREPRAAELVRQIQGALAKSCSEERTGHASSVSRKSASRC